MQTVTRSEEDYDAELVTDKRDYVVRNDAKNKKDGKKWMKV